MKKISLTLLSMILLAAFAYAQPVVKNVAKECVLLEVFTGIGCPYCPSAANGATDMLAQGHDIAPVFYHTSAFSSQEFYTPETNARAAYYYISSYPTAKIDGTLSPACGGNANSSAYYPFFNAYNQRINLPSPFKIEMEFLPIEGSADFRVNCSVKKVGENNSSNIRVFIALTQCNIPKFWQGMSSLNYVCRDLIPTHTGTPFTGDSLFISETFSIGTFPQEDLWLTAWVQDYSTKEVYQAVRASMNVPKQENDIVIKKVTDLPKNSCSGIIAPKIKVTNRGSSHLSSFVLQVKQQGQQIFQFTWNGDPLPFDQSLTIQVPEFQYTTFDDPVNLDFVVTQPNGDMEVDTVGKTITVQIQPALQTDEFIRIYFRTDSKPEESTIDIINLGNNQVMEHYTFDTPNKAYEYNISFPEVGCYRFILNDAGGDGISSILGIFDNNEQLLMSVGGTGTPNAFTDKIYTEIYVQTVDIKEEAQVQFFMAPNPSTGIVRINSSISTPYELTIFDMRGAMVYHDQQFRDGIVSLQNCNSGLYLVRIVHNGVQINKKLIIN